MNRKLYFEDGSILEIEFNIANKGGMATRAIQRLTEYLDEELIEEYPTILHEEEDEAEEDLLLDEEDLELDELEEDWLDDEEFEDEEFDEDEEAWEEEDEEFDDR